MTNSNIKTDIDELHKDTTSLRKGINEYMNKYKERLQKFEDMRNTVALQEKVKKNYSATNAAVITDTVELDKAFESKDPYEKFAHFIKFTIYNVNGNSNEFTLTPPDVSVSEGTLEDLKEESIYKIVSLLKDLSTEDRKNLPEINIPIFIFNINNILSNGNKNEVSMK